MNTTHIGDWKKSKPRKKKSKPESKIQLAVIKELLGEGFFVIRINSGQFATNTGNYYKGYTICNNGSSAGLSDLIAIKDGKNYYLEIKAPKGRQTNKQKDFEKLLQDYNVGEYYIIKSVDDLYQKGILWKNN